jgi:hypothetical protein
MCKKRLPYYTDLIIDREEKPDLADLCGFKSILTAKVFSRVMGKEPMGIEPFRELFYDLSKASLSLGLWKGQHTGLDGSFIKSNTSSSPSDECSPLFSLLFFLSNNRHVNHTLLCTIYAQQSVYFVIVERTHLTTAEIQCNCG